MIYSREHCFEEIGRTDIIWDLVVIGGGATGLGIALEATRRGYKVLLLERSDFAKGTSSRSTKLVHGGVRYLANGELKLVREACIERGRLLHNAPHLVKDQLFIIPIYSFWDKIKYSIGLKCYDWISGKWSFGPSRFIGKTEVLKKMPGIQQQHLLGGVVYHDGQFDDARLALNLAQTIEAQGGRVLNYCAVEQLLKNEQQQICGVAFRDVETGNSYIVSSKVVVNATGVFADEVLAMDNPNKNKILSVSQGVHLVIDASKFTSLEALMIPKTIDGRVLFAVPWHHKVVLGTTDTLVATTSVEPIAQEQEIDFILQTAALYFDQAPQRSDVLSVFVGLRPLASSQKEKQKTKEISRGHKILKSEAGLFTIIGGKWTTYRKMGEDMLNRIEREQRWSTTKSATRVFAIHGAHTPTDFSDPLYFYGSDAAAIRKLIQEKPNAWLSERLQIHEAQIVWAVHHEMARTLEDVLSRRTRALLLDAKESLRMADATVKIMAHELKKDGGWINAQMSHYTQLVQQYILSE